MRYAVLFGPPNSGKSTLFNRLTGQTTNVVNYPGSTVDVAFSCLKDHASVTLIDVPGVQSFLPRSEDEKLTLKAISQLDALVPGAHPIPDLIVCVIDATQCSRHLAMTKRLIDDGYPVIVIITMIDEAKKRGIVLDHVKLSEKLGVSVFQVNARKKDAEQVQMIEAGIVMNSVPCGRLTKPKPSGLDDLLHSYEWSKAMVSECESITPTSSRIDLDRWLLHPRFGYVFFIGVMVGFFALLFYAATPFMDAIDMGFSLLGEAVSQALPNGFIKNFMVNGLIAGFGGIIIFVPQIALLFLGMGIMEATGFLARSAVLIDKPLSKIGLNGRSFVPLLSGCACAIPAILATRTIPNRRVRMLTMLAIPLMQCGARLPVFGVLLGALFTSPIHGALGLTVIYVGSVVLAAVIVGITNRWAFKGDPYPNEFMIQLPKWRWPLWGELIRAMQKRTSAFITGAGPTIFIISLVLWAISEIHIGSSPLIYIIGQWIEPMFKPMGVDWRVGVALILSFAAREVFVSALAVVFQLSEDAPLSLTNLTMTDSLTPLFSTGTIIGLILFFMVAMQCGATYAVLKKEMASTKWPNIILIGYILLAYALAVLANALI
jgi:ferrous iron transport protein B